ncbi:carboxypeptidase regulatory-like domain-containing protein [Pseudoflavitalea sp. X16]|uniref:carboxypeptidase regulatory-like domain-containing protein n=1 Tax=Paraflavitalea devenefica TaxID=2716334 RepID=UPI00142385DA|nr:carboxypeptidase regulatory-like domain-containing protein [Paraflavitalea devenefica]NII29674.1 carboxypeptidase regulatory-like domain-containing protein [Paraflavitalea devenefica]
MIVTKSVKGVLHDHTSGKPVAGAIVMITGGHDEHPDIASQSDEEGVFYLPAIKIPGTYTLLIKYGERSKTVSVQVDADSVLNIGI